MCSMADTKQLPTNFDYPTLADLGDVLSKCGRDLRVSFGEGTWSVRLASMNHVDVVRSNDFPRAVRLAVDIAATVPSMVATPAAVPVAGTSILRRFVGGAVTDDDDYCHVTVASLVTVRSVLGYLKAMRIPYIHERSLELGTSQINIPADTACYSIIN